MTPESAAYAEKLTALGEAHLYGMSPVRARALSLLLCAVRLGDAKAAGHVGFMLEFGIGVAPPYELYERFYQAAAAHNHALSMV
ncbi:hypothetical protein GGF31_006030 [Allomyces arbusculus]|nr:hypothetical protein GGF31_006030 [Allomyces arbusculus]